MALRVCPSCARHAREAACPFCGAEIPHVDPVVSMPRVARSGLLGLAATAVVVGACSTAQPAYGIAIPDATPDASDGSVDSGTE